MTSDPAARCARSRLGGHASRLPACVAAARCPPRAAELELPVPRVTHLSRRRDRRRACSIERAFIAHTVARASVHRGARGARSARSRGARCCRASRSPSNAVARSLRRARRARPRVVVFEAGGLTITTSALALQTGGSATLVSLRNHRQRRSIIKGTVAPDGTVRVDGSMIAAARCSRLRCCLALLGCPGAGRRAHQGHRLRAGRARQPARRLRPGDRPQRHRRHAAQLALHRAVAAVDARPHGHQRAQHQARAPATSRPSSSRPSCRPSSARARASTSRCPRSAMPPRSRAARWC